MKLVRLRSAARGLLLVALAAACAPDGPLPEPERFEFVVYPESRYRGQLTDLTREAHILVKPDARPRIAIFDTPDSLEDVARFYARAYGRETIQYRDGDLAADVKAIEPLLPRLSIQRTDASKAVGRYRAADIEPRPKRPRVTVQRPYFDVTSAQVVDRTLILMIE
jgi:hypothetical protein